MTQVLTIHDSMALAEQLWPNANWTAALKELWIGVLKDLRQDILADAMREVRAEYTSREPELKWVRAKYGALYEQRRPLIRTREKGTNTYNHPELGAIAGPPFHVNCRCGEAPETRLTAEIPLIRQWQWSGAVT